MLRVMLPYGDARDFLDFAVTLLDKTPLERVEAIRAKKLFCPYEGEISLYHPQFMSGVDIDAVWSTKELVQLLVRVCRAKDLDIPAPLREAHIKSLFSGFSTQFWHGEIATQDFYALIEESLHRYDFTLHFAIEYFHPLIPEVAEYFSGKTGIALPQTPLAPSYNAPFRNPYCSHPGLASLWEGVGQTFICNVSTLSKLKEELAKSTCISLSVHEPPRYLPYAETGDMISFRTIGQVFHVLLASSTHAQLVVNLLRRFEGIVYARSPQGMLKFLSDKFSWEPNVVDIQPTLVEKSNCSIPKMSHISQLVTGANFCARFRTFSAHIKPSPLALRHRDIMLSLIYVFGMQQVRAHESPSERQEREALEKEDERRKVEARRAQELEDRREKLLRVEERLKHHEERNKEMREDHQKLLEECQALESVRPRPPSERTSRRHRHDSPRPSTSGDRDRDRSGHRSDSSKRSRRE